MCGDMHCHTTVSDGSMTPADLVDYAARIGLDSVAVTDHDSMAGIQSAQTRADECGVILIPGIEVSTYDYKHGKQAHLLCYWPSSPEPLLALCRQILKSRDEVALAITEKLSTKYPIDIQTVKKYAGGSEAVYKQHIVMALAQMGFTTSIFGDLFRELFSAKTGWARIDPKYPDTREAMRLIREAGGLSVLAHPGVYGNFDLIGELCDMGLQGIEACHPRQSADDEKAAFEAAACHKLIPTGGSDFHGMFSSRVTPLAARTAPAGTLDQLVKCYHKSADK